MRVILIKILHRSEGKALEKNCRVIESPIFSQIIAKNPIFSQIIPKKSILTQKIHGASYKLIAIYSCNDDYYHQKHNKELYFFFNR
jgi:hypothetical protein